MTAVTHGPRPDIKARLAALREALAESRSSAVAAAESAHAELLEKRGEGEGATEQQGHGYGTGQHA